MNVGWSQKLELKKGNYVDTVQKWLHNAVISFYYAQTFWLCPVGMCVSGTISKYVDECIHFYV